MWEISICKGVSLSGKQAQILETLINEEGTDLNLQTPIPLFTVF